ncbi:MAG: hypothetical protein KIT68_05660 [Phycisphaeraceae bacterium]|nr:hypothetical protein [Phycisphaeraceae bacterium]
MRVTLAEPGVLVLDALSAGAIRSLDPEGIAFAPCSMGSDEEFVVAHPTTVLRGCISATCGDRAWERFRFANAGDAPTLVGLSLTQSRVGTLDAWRLEEFPPWLFVSERVAVTLASLEPSGVYTWRVPMVTD